MPNQILADATASADIRSTTVVTSALPHVPNFADPKLGQLLRLRALRRETLQSGSKS